MSGSAASINLNRQAGGYKATISNPHQSEETKQNARQQLEKLEAQKEEMGFNQDDNEIPVDKNAGNVIGGYKATLKNPNVSDEAKQRAERFLEEHDALPTDN